MKEVCTINGKVWCVRQFKFDPQVKPRGRDSDSLAFYDLTTGEVWGRRVVVDASPEWFFIGRPKASMDMILPREWMDWDTLPVGLVCAWLVGEKRVNDLWAWSDN